MNKSMFSVLISAALLAAACNKSKDSAPPAAGQGDEAKTAKTEIVLSPAEQATAALEITPVAMSQQSDVLRANGRIALADDKTWRLGVRTDGIVIEVYAGLGDFVKKGQVLARFHADEVRETRAQYRAAVSELDRAKTVVAQAVRNRDRAQRLLELRAGSVQQVEQSQEDLADAQAAVRKAQIEIDRTTDELEDDLKVPVEPRPDDPIADDVPIIAPESGYVIVKNVTPGKTIDRVMDTFVLGDLSTVWMLASVRQEDLATLRLGQTVTVALPGDPSFQTRGRISNLGQQFDPETRMMQVRIELSNPNNRLRPEMLAIAEIPVGTAKQGVTVPSDAVQEVNGQDVVFVKTAPDRFAVRAVRVGETSGGRTPVLEGLNPGDQVAVHGSFILKSKLLKSTLESE
ncbi:MAG: efflux RND transporter periplasmic adaptor subunit [Bryobacteraceae bacterium]|jgi:multidrug efflux pump subunit AcrA (membrane-fusion protein)